MSKPNGAAKKAPTHFETVPLDVVKEIAAADVPTDRTNVTAGETVEPANRKLTMPVPTRAPAGKRR